MKLHGPICMMVLIVGLSVAGVSGQGTPNQWLDHSHTSYLAADFRPIDGSWSWEVVDAARSIRCRNDSSFVALLDNLDPVHPDKAMLWEAIVILTGGAAALAATEIDTTGMTRQQWQERYPGRVRYIKHSGHWWDYWNRLAQFAHAAYADSLLTELLHPQVVPLLNKIEQAFIPYLIVPPEYYIEARD